MSMTKRILFGRNPIDDPIRERMRREASEYVKDFTHRIAMNRRNPVGRPYWDPLWHSSLNRAARELEIEVVRINGGMFTREVAQRDAIKARAEIILQSMRAGGRA